MDGNRADVSGYYARGEGAQRQTVGFFQISARREAGVWKIIREVPIFPIPPEQKPILASDLIAMLDTAGIGKAIVLSEAFWWDSPHFATSSAAASVAAENDWTAAQAGLYPDRLTAFCSFNPLAAHAMSELERCTASKRFAGIKLSFAMSGVDIVKADHRRRVQDVFRTANRLRMPLVIHLSSGPGYGKAQAQLFVDEVLPLVPDVDVQIAHLWGGEAFASDALDVLVSAVQRDTPAARRLYFDVAEVWTAGSAERLSAVSAAIRAIGLDRIRYGSDAALNGRLTPAEAWRRLRFDVPLSDEEYRRIARSPSASVR
jgi:predicted TIM-barrel fold metal-dependent hydrolase